MQKFTVEQLKSLINNEVWSFEYSHAVVNREVVDNQHQVAGWLALTSSVIHSSVRLQIIHIKWFDCIAHNADSLTITDSDHPWQVHSAILVDESGNELSCDAVDAQLSALLDGTMHAEVSPSILDTCIKATQGLLKPQAAPVLNPQLS